MTTPPIDTAAASTSAKTAPRSAQAENTPSSEGGEWLRTLLVLPALLGLMGLLSAKPNSACRAGDLWQILWGLYLSVIVPPACGAFLPYAALRAWMREHSLFCTFWVLWVCVMAGMFLLLC